MVWQTCRVLANRSRLKIFGFITRNHGRTLSVVARAVNVTVVAASEYVQALATRGFLQTQRRGRWVECWLAEPHAPTIGHGLVTALASRLQHDKKAIDAVFRLATAFTHPRRVEIYQALANKAQTLSQLNVTTGIPRRPLLRHLHKLQTRGFISAAGQRPRRYRITSHTDNFGRALANLVLASR